MRQSHRCRHERRSRPLMRHGSSRYANEWATAALQSARAVSARRRPIQRRSEVMSVVKVSGLGLLASLAAVIVASAPAAAQQQQKPNILFIMGDDIGWMQPSIYHRGLMVGETPN